MTLDLRYDAGDDLHKRLYAHGVRHQGKVGYLLVCRVLLGHTVRTQQSGRDATMDGGSSIFPVTYRELCTVNGVSPPAFHHSLIAEVPAMRFREFIVFHGEYIYPEYIIAYQRYNNPHGPVG